MINKTKPVIDPTVLVFLPDKVINFGIVGGNVGTFQEHKKNFFLEYECKEKEVVPISTAINDKLNWGFSNAETIVETEGDKIKFSDGKDKYETQMQNQKPQNPKVAFREFVYDKDIGGHVPLFNYTQKPEWDKKSIDITSIFEVKKEELKLPQTNEYELIFDDSGLTVRIPEGGLFSRKIEGNVIRKEPISIRVDATHFNNIVDNVNGKVKLALTENLILFFEETKDHSSTFWLATNFEE
jgi:hypothetical protein